MARRNQGRFQARRKMKLRGSTISARHLAMKLFGQGPPAKRSTACRQLSPRRSAWMRLLFWT